MTAAEVVGALNALHGSAWAYAGELAGGFSRGAHLLRAPDGALAVLKHFGVRHRSEPPAAFAGRAVAFLDQLDALERRA